MTDTAAQLLEDILSARKLELDPSASMDDDEFFEFFSSQLALRDYKPNPSEIKSGLVSQTANSSSKGTDGGIDSMYLFVDQLLITDLEQARDLRLLKSKTNISF